MEERKAPPVSRVEATTQVVPAADFVDCFVSDDLLENGRRRLPVDPPQNEEAAVEPRCQQPFEIAVDGGQRLVRLNVAHKIAAQRDDVGSGTRRKVQAPEEFEPRAVRRLLYAPNCSFNTLFLNNFLIVAISGPQSRPQLECATGSSVILICNQGVVIQVLQPAPLISISCLGASDLYSGQTGGNQVR